MSGKTPVLDDKSWNVIKEQSHMLVKSGLLPAGIKTPEQAVAVALKGYELGIPIMQSFSHINIIQGKPTVSAELMTALIHKNCHGSIINFVKMDDESCVIEACRPGGKMHTFKYDREDAKAAGLLNRGSWKSYPRAMLRSRTVSEMARTLFPDAIMGCSYTPEEIAPDVVHYDPDSIALSQIPDIGQAPVPSSENPAPDQSQSSNDVMKLVKDSPSKKTFDKNNPDHIAKLDKLLVKKGMEHIKGDYKDSIYNKMHGKHSNCIDDVLTECYNEVFAVDMTPDGKVEIPF